MKVFSWTTAGAAALALTAAVSTAGTAQAAQQHYATATVSYSAASVRAPGEVRGKVEASACMSVVYVYVIDLKTWQVIDSAAARGHGRSFTVALRFPADVSPGTYETGGAFGRPCSARSGMQQLNPARGAFTSAVKVVR